MIIINSPGLFLISVTFLCIAGKARRLKQAKDEAQAEIDKFKQERERQFKEYEAKVSNDLFTDDQIFIQPYNVLSIYIFLCCVSS